MGRTTRVAATLGGVLVCVIGAAAALAFASALSAGSANAAGGATVGASASAAAPSIDDDTPPAIAWQLEVVRDGQTIDRFQATTTLGQAFSATHHDETTHRVGCKDVPAGSIDLARTISVSPIATDAGGVTLAIDANETIEDDTAPRTPEGCKLPPQPRRVSASHPGLVVPAGEWVAWTLIDKNPTLVYRLHASVAPH